MRELLTAADFGRGLDPPLTPAGVRAAARAGRIKVSVRTAGGVRLFTREELRRVQAARAKAAGSGPEAA